MVDSTNQVLSKGMKAEEVVLSGKSGEAQQILPPNSTKLFEQHTQARDRFMNTYYNLLDKQASSIDRNQKYYLEKLVTKDRNLSKQLSLYENYGKRRFHPSIQNPSTVISHYLPNSINLSVSNTKKRQPQTNLNKLIVREPKTSNP